MTIVVRHSHNWMISMSAAAGKSKGTTTIGFVSKRHQEVLADTGIAGTDHNARVYELRCQDCGHRYGANGTDIHVRKCPSCQGGRPGLPLSTAPIATKTPSRWSVADAKARFSEVIDTAQFCGAQIVTRNGRDIAVVVSFEEWSKKAARKGTLFEMFQSAPEGFADLDFSRSNETARDIDL